MGDLQISLLVIGALAVAGVYLFNWWQERQFRRRSEQAFAREHEDVLLEGTPARDADRVEPKMAADSAARPAAVRTAGKSPASAVPDPIIDYVVEVSLRTATDGTDLHDELLALVFALFQLNPAPFCLLDEVDAPLDDTNTERFCDLVRKMSANSQFLFISHNKITMEIASQLIGITMQEAGVSRVVAVDIEEAMKLAEEAA